VQRAGGRFVLWQEPHQAPGFDLFGYQLLRLQQAPIPATAAARSASPLSVENLPAIATDVTPFVNSF